MTCDEFCTFFNDVFNLIGIGMNSNLSLVFVNLVDTGIAWRCRSLLVVFAVIMLITAS